LPTVPGLDIDHGFGKRQADIDIRTPEGAALLRSLIAETDVLLESYRPGGLAHHGFGFDDVRAIRPDIVYVSLSAYGDEGPWGGRRGFDSVVQLTSGIAAREPSAKPQALPCQALDHGTGYLAAFATTASLIRRAREGGAWRVRLSLARTAEMLLDLGLDDHFNTPDIPFEQTGDSIEATATGIGTIQHVPVPGRIGARDFRRMPPLSSSADGGQTCFLPDR
jgi:crotonobetainyl-CoA:carnitine CoA-transferase CaiB-like acyl-CoA transferase